MLIWIIGITGALIIAGAISNLCDNIDSSDLPSAVKLLLKLIVWTAGIAGTIFLALLTSQLQSTEKSSKR